MNTTSSLVGPNALTCIVLLQHPIPLNLGGREAHALLRERGDVHEEPNGDLKVTRCGNALVLPTALTKEAAEAEEILALRKFIIGSEPRDYFRNSPNSREFSRGKEIPGPNSFSKPVAEALQGTVEVLVFGTGMGKSNEMDPFVAWVRVHQPDLSARIIGAVVVDEHHLTEAQLLADARDC